MQEQYRPDLVESRIQKYWQDNKTFKVQPDPSKENITAYQCSLILPVVYIWGTFVITLSAMLSPVINE